MPNVRTLLVVAFCVSLLACNPSSPSTGRVVGTGGIAAAAGTGGVAEGGASGAAGGTTGGSGVGDATGGSAATGAGSNVGGSVGGVGGTTGAAAGADGAGAVGGDPLPSLGMNDVTVLVTWPSKNAPLVLLRGTDLADDGTAFVPRYLFDRLLSGASTAALPKDEIYADLKVVAVRFDLCDRHLPGICPLAEDGRLRVVFQAIGGSPVDTTFHAMYTIRNDELAEAVKGLRELARMGPPTAGWPLQVSPALSAAAADGYVTKLQAFVKRYGGEARLVRLTTSAAFDPGLRWVFRGVEKREDGFVDMTIAGTTETAETVTLVSGPGYDVIPLADTPTGLRGAMTATMFDAADATKKRGFLASLAAVENPLRNTAETVPCVGCHVSTFVTHSRAISASIDPLTIPGRYTSTFDLSLSLGLSRSAITSASVRALGYLDGGAPMISQRVVNETAQTLAEIRERYP